MFLCLRPIQRFLFFLTFVLAFSFNYLDVVILGKAALSIMVCLPSKQSPLPPYLCELIHISSSNCSLPLSAYPHLHSSVLFLSFQLSPFWNNNLFPLSFPLAEDVFGHIPEKLWHESIPMPFCVSIRHISRGVSLAGSLRPSHQVKPGSGDPVQHHTALTAGKTEATGLASLAPSGKKFLLSNLFQEGCWRYKNMNLLWQEEGLKG